VRRPTIKIEKETIQEYDTQIILDAYLGKNKVDIFDIEMLIWHYYQRTLKLYEYKTVANTNQNNSLITNEVKIIILFLNNVLYSLREMNYKKNIIRNICRQSSI
jgi:hypothetical protein